jgi:hypothetical protein
MTNHENSEMAFVQRLGRIALEFAWLEEALELIIAELCGTKKAAVLASSINFSSKCSRIIDLMVYEENKEFIDFVQSWIKRCRKAALSRNAAVHTAFLKTTDVKVEPPDKRYLITAVDRKPKRMEIGELDATIWAIQLLRSEGVILLRSIARPSMTTYGTPTRELWKPVPEDEGAHSERTSH